MTWEAQLISLKTFWRRKRKVTWIKVV